jgi:hypothetical protein
MKIYLLLLFLLTGCAVYETSPVVYSPPQIIVAPPPRIIVAPPPVYIYPHFDGGSFYYRPYPYRPHSIYPKRW